MIVFFGAEFTKQDAVYHDLSIEAKPGATKNASKEPDGSNAKT
jgi:hypothetical protein